MRKIAKGHDGWYFENKKIEDAKEEEIQAWNDLWCNYCSGGSIYPKNKSGLSAIEMCKESVPCPVCFGTGFKDHSKYFKYADNAKILNVKEYISKESFNLIKRCLFELDFQMPGQQDGRPIRQSYQDMIIMYHIGWAIYNKHLK